MALNTKAQKAVFAGPGYSPTFLTDVNISVATPTIARTIATAMKAPEFDTTLPVVSASGLHINSSLGLAQSSCMTIGAGFDVADWTIQKTWPLYPATPCGSSEIRWEWRMPIVSGRLRGWCTGDTDEFQQGLTFAATWNVFGTATADCKVTAIQIGIPKRYGGSCPISLAFQSTGLVGATGTPAAAIFHSDIEDPLEGTFSITNATGPQPSWNALQYQFSVSSNSDRGGPLIFRSNYRRSKSA